MRKAVAALFCHFGDHARGCGFAIAASNHDFFRRAGSHYRFEHIWINAPRYHAGQAGAAADAQDASRSSHQFAGGDGQGQAGLAQGAAPRARSLWARCVGKQRWGFYYFIPGCLCIVIHYKTALSAYNALYLGQYNKT